MICTAFLLWLKDLVHMVETSLFSEFVEEISAALAKQHQHFS
jgi:hypothetical protein